MNSASVLRPPECAFIGVDIHRVRFHQHGGLQGQFLLLLDVVAHVAQLLLHHPHRFKVCRVVEGVAPQQQQLHPGREEEEEKVLS